MKRVIGIALIAALLINVQAPLWAAVKPVAGLEGVRSAPAPSSTPAVAPILTDLSLPIPSIPISQAVSAPSVSAQSMSAAQAVSALTQLGQDLSAAQNQEGGASEKTGQVLEAAYTGKKTAESAAVSAGDSAPDADAALARRGRDGDRKARQELAVKYRAKAFWMALRMTADRAEADDLAQDAVSHLLSHLGKYEGKAAFGTFAHTLMRNVMLMHFRYQKHRFNARNSEPIEDEGAPSLLGGLSSSGHPGDALADRQVLERSWSLLPEKDKAILDATMDEEQGAQKLAAEAMGLNPKTLKVKKHYALEKWKKLIELIMSGAARETLVEIAAKARVGAVAAVFLAAAAFSGPAQAADAVPAAAQAWLHSDAARHVLAGVIGLINASVGAFGFYKYVHFDVSLSKASTREDRFFILMFSVLFAVVPLPFIVAFPGVGATMSMALAVPGLIGLISAAFDERVEKRWSRKLDMASGAQLAGFLGRFDVPLSLKGRIGSLLEERLSAAPEAEALLMLRALMRLTDYGWRNPGARHIVTKSLARKPELLALMETEDLAFLLWDSFLLDKPEMASAAIPLLISRVPQATERELVAIMRLMRHKTSYSPQLGAAVSARLERMIEGEGPDPAETMHSIHDSTRWFEGQEEAVKARMPTFWGILRDRAKTGRLLSALSLLRLAFPYDLANRSDLPPIAWANETGIEFRIKELRIAPVSESFRRHILYTRDAEGETFALELKMPGQDPNRWQIPATHFDLAAALWRQAPQDPAVVMPVYFKQYGGALRLYMKDETFGQPTPLGLALFRYEDGKRFRNARRLFETLALKKESAPDTDVYRGLVDQAVMDAAVGVIRLHRLGWQGENPVNGTEMHDENFRVHADGRAVLVADFAAVEKTFPSMRQRARETRGMLEFYNPDIAAVASEVARRLTEGVADEAQRQAIIEETREELGLIKR